MDSSDVKGCLPGFIELLQQLADEHHREVGELHAEVARLQQVCQEITTNPMANTNLTEASDSASLQGHLGGLLEKDDTSSSVLGGVPTDRSLQFDMDIVVEETPDEDALEAALQYASGVVAETAATLDAIPSRSHQKGAGRQKKKERDNSDGQDSDVGLEGCIDQDPDVEVADGIMSHHSAMFQLAFKPTEDSTVLGYWRTLIKAVEKKRTIESLPELSHGWQQIADSQSHPGRRGIAFQLDMLVSRATRVKLVESENDWSVATSLRMYNRLSNFFSSDGWIGRACRKSILHPMCAQRVCWDVAGMILLVHDLIFIPMLAFDIPKAYKRFLDGLDIVTASFWSVDIFVSLRTGFYSAEGFVELRPWPVAKNYLKSWFPLDLTIVCIDWGSMLLGMSDAAGFMRLGKSISRFMRVVRLLRFLKMNRALKEIMERVNSEVLLQVFGLMKTLVLIVLINHYIACAWFGLGTMGLISRWPEKFLVNYPNSFAYAYTTSLHWSLTQFTPASMEVVPQNSLERFFVIAVIIVALVAFSSFVSSITAAMTHIRQINAEKIELESKIRQFFSEHKISHAMASRVWHFLRRNRINASKRLKESDIPAFKMLPERIKEDLRMEIYAPILTLHPLFGEYCRRDEIAMLRICNDALVDRFLAVGEELWRDVDYVQEMLFMVFGRMCYYEKINQEFDEDEEPVEVHAGQWACEPALWASKATLPGMFMALTDGCELTLLSADKLLAISRNFKDSMGFLVRYAINFMESFRSVSSDCQLNGNLSRRDVLFNSIDRAEELVQAASGQSGFGRSGGVSRLGYGSVRSSASTWTVGTANSKSTESSRNGGLV